MALGKLDCGRARELLMQTVVEYQPAGDIQDLVWNRKTALSHGEAKNVTALQTRRARLSSPTSPGAH